MTASRRTTRCAVLTDDLLAVMEASPQRCVLWDHEMPGFGVDIHRTGTKRFVYVAREFTGANPVKHTIGYPPEMSCDEARAAAQTMREVFRSNRKKRKITKARAKISIMRALAELGLITAGDIQ